MAQVDVGLAFKGFIGPKVTISIRLGKVRQGEVDAISAYAVPWFGTPLLRVDNIRTEMSGWFGRARAYWLLFDLTNLSGAGVPYEVRLARISP